MSRRLMSWQTDQPPAKHLSLMSLCELFVLELSCFCPQDETSKIKLLSPLIQASTGGEWHFAWYPLPHISQAMMAFVASVAAGPSLRLQTTHMMRPSSAGGALSSLSVATDAQAWVPSPNFTRHRASPAPTSQESLSLLVLSSTIVPVGEHVNENLIGI